MDKEIIVQQIMRFRRSGKEVVKVFHKENLKEEERQVLGDKNTSTNENGTKGIDWYSCKRMLNSVVKVQFGAAAAVFFILEVGFVLVLGKAFSAKERNGMEICRVDDAIRDMILGSVDENMLYIASEHVIYRLSLSDRTVSKLYETKDFIWNLRLSDTAASLWKQYEMD